MSRTRIPLAVGAVAGTVAVVLGLWNAGRGYNYDEAVTVAAFVSTGSPTEAYTGQVVFNNHPTFSAVQSVWWALGAESEPAQRVLPVLYGAVAVGLVAAWTCRRWGALAGSVAGATLVMTPLFLHQHRAVRGYSLAVLAVVIAAIALEVALRDRRRRWLVIHGVALVVAVTTHAYSAVAALVLAAVVLGLGALERRLVVTWVAAALTAIAMQLPLVGGLLDASEERGRRFRSGFPGQLARELVGATWPAVVVVGGLAVAGTVAIALTSPRHTRALAGGVLVVVVVALAVWLVARPTDLYPRFFITIVPFVAVLAGRGVAVLPRPADAVAAVAVVVVLASGVVDVIDGRVNIREAAPYVDAARSLGLEPCARGAPPLAAYTEPPPPASVARGFGECDVFVSIGSTSGELVALAEREFPHRWDLGGEVEIFARVPRSTLTPTP